MYVYYHKDRQEHAAKAYAIAVEHYPDHAAPAKGLVIDYLSRYAPERLRLFLGEVADRNHDAYCMDVAHSMISALLYERDNGNPKVTEQVIDIQARVYLELPYAVIEGDKA